MCSLTFSISNSIQTSCCFGVCICVLTFSISNSITGIFRAEGSMRWRTNFGDPNVNESMSSEATAYTWREKYICTYVYVYQYAVHICYTHTCLCILFVWCIYIHICLCILCMRVYIYTHIYTYIMYEGIYIHICTCLSCMYVIIYTHMFMYIMYVVICIYTCAHVHQASLGFTSQYSQAFLASYHLIIMPSPSFFPSHLSALTQRSTLCLGLRWGLNKENKI